MLYVNIFSIFFYKVYYVCTVHILYVPPFWSADTFCIFSSSVTVENYAQGTGKVWDKENYAQGTGKVWDKEKDTRDFLSYCRKKC